jgi:hypothetical protein
LSSLLIDMEDPTEDEVAELINKIKR